MIATDAPFGLHTTLACVLALQLVAGCGKSPSTPGQGAEAQPPRGSTTPGAQATTQVPKRGPTGPLALTLRLPAASTQTQATQRRGETNAALTKAWTWAKSLRPHPVEMREKLKMSGKKHLVEYLALLRLVAAWPDQPALSKAAVARAHEVLAWTDSDAFHDMARVDDGRFRNESMSYLRCALLAREFGWDIRPYMAHIHSVLPRLVAHLPSRGVDQQMSFADLFAALGLSGSTPRQALYPRSRIAQLTPFKHWVSHPKQVYEFTHEVFAMTGRGARPFPFRRPIEQRYARKVAHTLLHIHMTEKNHDGVAELLVNRVLLADAKDAQVPVARRFLLAGQDAKGRFGHYDQAEVRHAFNSTTYDVELGGYLHTTMVALWALMLTSG